MNLLALDLATHCGWATSDGRFGVWDLSAATDAERCWNLRQNLVSMSFEAVVYERPLVSRGGRTVRVLGQLEGVLLYCCMYWSIECREFTVQEVKRHATGKGNATKAEMIAAAREKWPDKNIVSDDEADALWLCNLAESQLIEK